mmetsp:Transcript_16345/g.49011  ORF Transcript_16345/g.49011 Transcript_16345/m.49011 type:complete len:280 (+) Transcript_16345:212-1051(+)
MTAPSNKQMTCTQCGSCDLEEDLEQAMSFCLECGYVMRGTDLRASLPTAQEDIGIFVSKGDDGSRAAAYALKRSGPQPGKRYLWSTAAPQRARAKLDRLVGLLALPPSVAADAAVLLERAATRPTPADLDEDLWIGTAAQLSAAAAYVAARCAQMPLPLLDAAEAAEMKANVLGGAVQRLVRHLNMALPAVPAALVLRHTLQRACPSAQVPPAPPHRNPSCHVFTHTQALPPGTCVKLKQEHRRTMWTLFAYVLCDRCVCCLCRVQLLPGRGRESRQLG